MARFFDPALDAVLDRLHAAARADWKHFIGLAPYVLWSKLTGKGLMDLISPSQMKEVYIPVTREQGRLLYVLARAIAAQRVVEFGASFGISTLYLAAAVRDNGGGEVITTEIEPSKCRATEENLRSAGLAGVGRVLEGDALQTLRGVTAPIDLVFLDGWKNLYLPVLELLVPSLRKGALVLADNIDFPDVRPYLAHVRAHGSGFVSSPLPDGRTECSYFTGAPKAA